MTIVKKTARKQIFGYFCRQYYPLFSNAACAAAKRAIGTLNGEQLT